MPAFHPEPSLAGSARRRPPLRERERPVLALELSGKIDPWRKLPPYRDVGKVKTMTDPERRLLTALAAMCDQYIGRHSNTHQPVSVDHLCLSAGERAVALLIEYGLVGEDDGRGGLWTEAGLALLATA